MLACGGMMQSDRPVEAGTHRGDSGFGLNAVGIPRSLGRGGCQSSLSYLHNLVFNQLKIDRQFVRDIEHDGRSESVVSSVLMLSHTLKVPLVAEGIETQEMNNKLRDMGCDLAQGYYYGRPKPFAEWTVQEGRFVITYG